MSPRTSPSSRRHRWCCQSCYGPSSERIAAPRCEWRFGRDKFLGIFEAGKESVEFWMVVVGWLLDGCCWMVVGWLLDDCWMVVGWLLLDGCGCCCCGCCCCCCCGCCCCCFEGERYFPPRVFIKKWKTGKGYEDSPNKKNKGGWNEWFQPSWKNIKLVKLDHFRI